MKFDKIFYYLIMLIILLQANYNYNYAKDIPKATYWLVLACFVQLMEARYEKNS